MVFTFTCPGDLPCCIHIGTFLFSGNSRVKFYTTFWVFVLCSPTPKADFQRTAQSYFERKVIIFVAFKASHIEYDLFFLCSKQLAHRCHILWGVVQNGEQLDRAWCSQYTGRACCLWCVSCSGPLRKERPVTLWSKMLVSINKESLFLDLCLPLLFTCNST